MDDGRYLEVRKVMEKLAERRPIFHSEADFKFALAWQIQRMLPRFDVRLEYPATEGQHLDVLLIGRNVRLGIELKYKTGTLSVVCRHERFELKKHGGGCYDYLKDVKRLEELVKCGAINRGYALFLTNDRMYWIESRRCTVNDGEFRLHEDRRIRAGACLRWPRALLRRTRNGSVLSRRDPIRL
jgi:hypothetical protein